MEKILYDEINMETIETLANIVKNNDLGEITITEGDRIITVKGKNFTPVLQTGTPFSAGSSPVSLLPAAEAGQNPVAAAVQSAVGNIVKSPIVGTFYAASAPDKPPFVSIGQRVRKGDVLMIIESMKLMNEVQSDYDGVVKDILINNGDAVEFDQPIMIIGS